MPNAPYNYETLGPISYPQRGKDTVLSPPSGANLAIGEVVLTNRSGSAIDVGWGMKLPNAIWKAGSITAASTPDYLNDTTDAQSAATGDFPLFTTTTNSGFLVQSTAKFNLIGITISTAASGGSPVYAYQYYNGSSMTTLTLVSTPVYTATGDVYIVFAAPHDWAKGSTAAVGADSDKYCIQVLATTASSTAGGTADILWVGQLYDFYPSLGNNSALNTEMKGEMVLLYGAGFLPYFGSASASNTVEIYYRPLGYIPS